MTTDHQQRRIEAAAKAMKEALAIRGIWTQRPYIYAAKAALAAADAVDATAKE